MNRERNVVNEAEDIHSISVSVVLDELGIRGFDIVLSV